MCSSTIYIVCIFLNEKRKKRSYKGFADKIKRGERKSKDSMNVKTFDFMLKVA